MESGSDSPYLHGFTVIAINLSEISHVLHQVQCAGYRFGILHYGVCRDKSFTMGSTCRIQRHVFAFLRASVTLQFPGFVRHVIPCVVFTQLRRQYHEEQPASREQCESFALLIETYRFCLKLTHLLT